MPRNPDVWRSFYDENQDDYNIRSPYDFNFNQQGPSRPGGLNSRRFQFELPEPDYTTPAPQQNRNLMMPGLEPPSYNQGPGNRYSQYLQEEPTRDQYKQGGLQRILTAAGAGLEGMQHGLPAAVKYTEYMKEKPYE